MRLFFGLSLPDDIRRLSAMRAEEAMRSIEGRYLPASNHHITLAFLGEVPPKRLGDAQRVLASVCARFPAPRLTLGETGYFGRAQNGILIIHVSAEPSLLPLHNELIRALAAAGLPYDCGPFSPHITLARHARIGGLPLPGGPAHSFVPSSAHLFLSARNEENVLTYTALHAVPFSSCSP